MFVLMIVLAVTVQSLVNHKYVGHLVVILYWVVWCWVGFELVPHNLIAYPVHAHVVLLGHERLRALAGGWRWYMLFWAGVAVLLAIAEQPVLGAGDGGRPALAHAPGPRAPDPSRAGGRAGGVALVLATGGFIVHNTAGLNEWETEDESGRIVADYEKLYKRYESLPMPAISAATLQVDIFPESRDLRHAGNVPAGEPHGAADSDRSTWTC